MYIGDYVILKNKENNLQYGRIKREHHHGGRGRVPDINIKSKSMTLMVRGGGAGRDGRNEKNINN